LFLFYLRGQKTIYREDRKELGEYSVGDYYGGDYWGADRVYEGRGR